MNKIDKLILKIKPPKCPYCRKEINELIYVENAIRRAICHPTNKQLEYFAWKTVDVEYWFECPECLEKLFDSEEEAYKFLKGEFETEEKH